MINSDNVVRGGLTPKLKDVDTYEDMIIEFKKLDKDKDGKIPAPEFK